MKKMKTDLHEFIRELSDLYDTDSLNTYISLYLNHNTLDTKFIQRREKVITSLLKGEERQNFIKTMNEIKEFLKKNVQGNIALFASHKYALFKYLLLPVEIENVFIVDSSPYIRPLARIVDEWESFTLVLLSSNYAKIYSVSFGDISVEKNLSKDIMNRHKKGGCSQARFQRLRKGAIHAFLTEVVESLEPISDKRIVLAGPGTAKLQFRDMLPKYLVERIVDIIDIGIDDENELLRQSTHLIVKREEQKSREAVQQLKEEILKDGLAVYGIDETLQAVKNGQVELLIIEKNYKTKGWICERCQVVKKGKVKKCPYCGNPVSEVDMIEEILEFAERTNANIEFTDEEDISNLGHVGAILRYK